MGDSVSKYYDDRDDYIELCNELNIEVKDDFYKHQREILNNLGFNSLYEYYDNLRIVNVRDNKIEEIISKI
jgi:methionine synthase II (cobalamin-independent)